MSIAVEFQDVVKRFPNATETPWIMSDFQIQEKEMITILGTSGCGKTTLMKMVNRLYDPTSGEIHVFGENIQKTDPVQLRRKNRICDPAGGLVSAHDRCKKILQWYRKSLDGMPNGSIPE